MKLIDYFKSSVRPCRTWNDVGIGWPSGPTPRIGGWFHATHSLYSPKRRPGRFSKASGARRRPEPTLDNPAVDHPLKARKGTSWVWPFRLPVGKAGSTTLAGRAAPPMIVRSVAAVLVATMTAAKKVHRLTVISSGQTGRSDDGLLVRVDEANLDGHRLADWPPFQLGSADEVAGVARIRFARGPQLHSRKRIGSTGGVLLVSQSQSSTRRCFRHEAGLGGWRHGRSRVGRQSWRHDVTSSDIAVDLHAVDASTEQPLNS